MTLLVPAAGLVIVFAFFGVLTWVIASEAPRLPVPPPAGEQTVEMARRLRLRIDSNAQLAGRRAGLEIRVAQVIQGWWIRVWPSCTLPENGRVTAILEQDHVAWRFKHGADSADWRWLLGAPDVLDAVEVLVKSGHEARIGDGAVEIVVGANDTVDALPLTIALARAISERRMVSVRSLLERLGLPVERYARSERQVGGVPVRLVGRVDELRLEVVLPWLDGHTWRATIQAEFRTPLPEGTEILGVTDDGEPSVELGDLIFDSSPVVVHTSDPAALAERICRDEVRAPLLDAICDNPGSEVSADGIQVELAAGALDIDGAVLDVLRLVEALG